MLLSLALLSIYPIMYLAFMWNYGDEKSNKTLAKTLKFPYLYLAYVVVWAIFAKSMAYYFLPSIIISALTVNAVTYASYLKIFKIKMTSLEIKYLILSFISIIVLTLAFWTLTEFKPLHMMIIGLLFLIFNFSLKPYNKIEVNPMRTLESFLIANWEIIVAISIGFDLLSK